MTTRRFTAEFKKKVALEALHGLPERFAPKICPKDLSHTRLLNARRLVRRLAQPHDAEQPHAGVTAAAVPGRGERSPRVSADNTWQGRRS